MVRNAMDIATISCSVVSKVDQQAGVIENVRITFGVAAPVPYRCTKAEEALKGMTIEESLDETRKSIREIPGEHPGHFVSRLAEKLRHGH